LAARRRKIGRGSGIKEAREPGTGQLTSERKGERLIEIVESLSHDAWQKKE